MLLNSLVFLLLSNSITSRRDKSILYSRITISILLISTLITYDNLSLLFLAKGIGIFGGLFHTTATTNTFHIFIFLITSVILLLTSFYPRKVWLKQDSSPNRILFTKLIYYGTLITNKMGEQFKIIEYSLIILFIVTGSVFLISTSDLVSIFLSTELQNYGLYLLSTICRDSEPATSGGLMYFLLGLVLHISLVELGLSKYISDPMVFFRLSDDLIMSGFYSGKGKGKAIVPAEQESIRPQSKSEWDSDSDNGEELRKAIALSLQQDKKGESSKNELYKDDSPVKENYEIIAGYTQSWKTLNDSYMNTAKKHNELKIELDKQTHKNPSDVEKLAQYLENSKQLKVERDTFENKLLLYGVNPSEQFYQQSEPDTESNYSSYSSESELKRNNYSSDSSESRPKKRIKSLNPDNNLNLTLGFSIYKIGLNITFILRVLSAIASGVFLLAIQLNIFPNLTIPFIDISLTQLLTIYLIVNLVRFFYKCYYTVISLYKIYLNKDYIIIYSNLYFSIIILLLYFSCNSDIYILYF